MFRTTAPKPEAQGEPLTIQLIIQKYSDNEVKEFIENPIVVDDTDNTDDDPSRMDITKAKSTN
jgi:hypothetical protein